MQYNTVGRERKVSGGLILDTGYWIILSGAHLLKKVNQALMVGQLDKTEKREKRQKKRFWGSFRDFLDFLRHPKVMSRSHECNGIEHLSI